MLKQLHTMQSIYFSVVFSSSSSEAIFTVCTVQFVCYVYVTASFLLLLFFISIQFMCIQQFFIFVELCIYFLSYPHDFFFPFRLQCEVNYQKGEQQHTHTLEKSTQTKSHKNRAYGRVRSVVVGVLFLLFIVFYFHSPSFLQRMISRRLFISVITFCRMYVQWCCVN